MRFSLAGVLAVVLSMLLGPCLCLWPGTALRLQKWAWCCSGALASIDRLGHPAFGQATERLCRYAIERAAHAGLFEAGLQGLRDAAAKVRPAGPV